MDTASRPSASRSLLKLTPNCCAKPYQRPSACRYVRGLAGGKIRDASAALREMKRFLNLQFAHEVQRAKGGTESSRYRLLIDILFLRIVQPDQRLDQLNDALGVADQIAIGILSAEPG